MTKKCISWVISLLVLVSCFAMPIGTVQAETVAKDFTFSANFDNLDDLAAGEIDEAVFAEKTGLTITKSALSSVSDGVVHLYGSIKDSDPKKKYRPEIIYTLPETIKTGTLTASVKVPAESLEKAGIEGRGVQFFRGIVTPGEVFSINYADSKWYGTNASGVVYQNFPQKDENGAYNFRIVYTRENETDNWTVTTYDISNATPAQIGKVRTGTGDITSLTLIHLEPLTENSAYELTGDSSVLIDDINITYDNGVLDEATSFSFNANFDNLADGAVNATTFTKDTGLTIAGSKLSSVTDGVLTLDGTRNDQDVRPSLTYNLPGAVKKGTLTASLKVPAESVDKVGIAGCNIRFFHTTHVDDTATDFIFRYSNARWLNYLGNVITATAVEKAYTFCIVYTRESETDNWTVTVYNDSSATPYVLATKELTNTNAIKALPLIVTYPLTKSELAGAELDGDSHVLIDDVNVTYDDGETPTPTPEPTAEPTPEPTPAPITNFTHEVNFNDLADGAVNAEAFKTATGLTITQEKDSV
ncbi:MAG: hypothetical protein IKB60_03180, partial [Clostridia bacterium]|nr:hypothetical protein [Clostridia bacterium]